MKMSVRLACAFVVFFCLASAGARAQEAAPKKEFENSLVPGFQGGGFFLFRDQAFYWGAELRFDLTYDLDEGRPSARALDRGRSEIYVAAGLYYSPRSDAEFLCDYCLGFNVSLETPSALARNYLVPYLGLEAGGLTIKDRGTGLAVCPLIGLNFVSLERFSLSLETALLLSTVAFDEFLALKANLAMVFVF